MASHADEVLLDLSSLSNCFLLSYDTPPVIMNQRIKISDIKR